MPEEIVAYISKYGYLAILTIIVLQEIGVPNPVPVELLMFFTGYLSYKGLLYLPFVILTAIAADFIGANILYFIFYTSGIFLLKKKPRWLPLSEKKINRFKEKINTGGRGSIFLFRLVSITRGYAAVISGLLHLKLRVYLPTVIMAAVSWTVVYSVLGFALGSSWNILSGDIKHFKFVLFGILLIVACIFIFLLLRKRHVVQK